MTFTLTLTLIYTLILTVSLITTLTLPPTYLPPLQPHTNPSAPPFPSTTSRVEIYTHARSARKFLSVHVNTQVPPNITFMAGILIR
jgi:hypothetical protein